MAVRGRKKKYDTGKQLQAGVDAYWNSISYQKPAVVSMPTGEVDENGRIKYATKMLTMNEDGSINWDGTGKPKTVTEFLEPPSVAGLCVFLGISKDTWAAYAKDEKLGTVCARFKLRMESYLVARLEGEKGKSVQGVMFNLKNNFGWKDKVDVTQTSVGLTLEEYLEQRAQEGAEQEF